MVDNSHIADELIPLRQAARRLGVPTTWLRGEVNEGRLPGLRAGASILVDLAMIRRLLLERARSTIRDGVATAPVEGSRQ